MRRAALTLLAAAGPLLLIAPHLPADLGGPLFTLVAALAPVACMALGAPRGRPIITVGLGALAFILAITLLALHFLPEAGDGSPPDGLPPSMVVLLLLWGVPLLVSGLLYAWSYRTPDAPPEHDEAHRERS